jgi:hypothetical protein
MGITFDLTSASAVLKELYFGQVPENLVYKQNPALALLQKKTDAVGKSIPIPLIYGVTQGRSGTFANAQANQSPLAAVEFQVTRVTDYALATIDQHVMLASKSDKGAFVDGLKTHVDGAFRSASNSAASSIFRSGTGTIGSYASGGISTGVITLQTPADVVNFEINQVLNVHASDGGAKVASSVDGFVIAVDRSAGTITVALTQGGSAINPTNWPTAATTYLTTAGDLNAKMSGFSAWIPDSAPTSSAFFTIDRTKDTVRLGGLRYDGTAQPVEEALVDAAGLAAREGGSPDTAFCSFATYTALSKSLGSKVQYVDLQGPGQVGFRGIRVNGAAGEIKVIPDRNCRQNRVFLLQMDTWKLLSINDVPHLFMYADGLEALRVYNADAAEARVGYYAQLACSAPGWNVNVATSA